MDAPTTTVVVMPPHGCGQSVKGCLKADCCISDLSSEPLGTGRDGEPVYLKDIWPTNAEIDALLGRTTQPLDREADLEAFVLEHGAANEEALLRFFQKRCLRHEALFEPVARELRGKKTQLL